MNNKTLLATGTSLFSVLLCGGAMAEPVFNRAASFPVALTLPDGADPKTPTSAEIITATPDGMTLIFSDSPGKRIGFIDITDPKAPKPAGSVALEGEPTSVAAVGNMVLVAVNTSRSKTDPSGALLAIDAAARSISLSCGLGGQPDSASVSPDGTIAAVAIENERDEDLNDGEIPQMPAGNLQIFTLKDSKPDCGSKVTAAVIGLAGVAGAGEKNGQLRESDTIQWLDAGRVVVANEGDDKERLNTKPHCTATIQTAAIRSEMSLKARKRQKAGTRVTASGRKLQDT